MAWQAYFMDASFYCKSVKKFRKSSFAFRAVVAFCYVSKGLTSIDGKWKQVYWKGPIAKEVYR